MDSQYYVLRASGEKDGPFDEVTLRQMVASGQVNVGDKVEDASTGSVWEPSVFAPPPGYAGEAPSSKKSNVVYWVIGGALFFFVAFIAVIAAVLFPVFSQAKEAAKFARTSSDLKQVGMALSTYQLDFDDKYPPAMDSLSRAWTYLDSYAKTPMPESGNPRNHAILGNGKLAGTAVTKLVAPAKTLVFFDAESWPSDKRVVLSADGAVTRLREGEYQAAAANGFVLK